MSRKKAIERTMNKALTALVLRQLEEAGGTLDEKLRHQIVMDIQADIRQGGQNALDYWRDEVKAARWEGMEEAAKIAADRLYSIYGADHWIRAKIEAEKKEAGR